MKVTLPVLFTVQILSGSTWAAPIPKLEEMPGHIHLCIDGKYFSQFEISAETTQCLGKLGLTPIDASKILGWQ